MDTNAYTENCLI